MNFINFNILNPLKMDIDKDTQIFNYFCDLLEKKCNSFKIEGCDTPGAFILRYKYLNGSCAMIELDGKYYVGYGGYGGNVTPNGLGDKYIVTLPNGFTKECIPDVDCVILWNKNNLRGDVVTLLWQAELLAETDISIKNNVLFSRLLPIPIVENDNQKKSILKVLEDLFKGKLQVIKNASFNSFLNDKGNELNTLDLTKAQDSQYIQHLSRFHNELIIRFCREMGVDITAVDKGAQLNESELTAFANYSAISINDEWELLMDWQKRVKEVFNLDLTIERKDFTLNENELYEDNEEGVEVDDNTRIDKSNEEE